MRKRIPTLLVAAWMILCLCTGQALAATPPQKPSLRLDVRSEKQAVLIISDPQMTTATGDIRYDVRIGGYQFRLTWEVEEHSGIPGNGSVMYFEASDNSRVYMGGTTYSDGAHITSVLRPNETTLELWMDFSRPGLSTSIDDSRRDLSGKLQEIDFTTFFDEAQVHGYFDEREGEPTSYAREQYYSKRKLGLVFVLEPPSYGFDRMRDFGTSVGLTQDEFDKLYFTPKTDNYIVLNATTTHSFQYLSESYSGDADTYELMWFDADGLPLGMHTLFVCQDEGASMANFRNVETDARIADLLDRWIGRIPPDENTAYQIVWIYNDEFIEMLRKNGVTKERQLNSLSADTKVIKNSDGEVRP